MIDALKDFVTLTIPGWFDDLRFLAIRAIEERSPALLWIAVAAAAILVGIVIALIATAPRRKEKRLEKQRLRYARKITRQ